MLFSMATLVNVLCAVLAVCGAFVDFVPEEGNCCDSDCESCIDLNCSGDLCSSLTAVCFSKFLLFEPSNSFADTRMRF